MENRKAIFEGSGQDKELFAKLIPSLFPPGIAVPLFNRLETASTGTPVPFAGCSCLHYVPA